MSIRCPLCSVSLSLGFLLTFAMLPAHAAKVTVELSGVENVKFVGAIQRWDSDGNHRRLPDPKAAIDAPALDASAVNEGKNRWVFKNLPKGTYDLVILCDGRIRIEGFQYVPVLEFDPFISPDAQLDDETRDTILDDIRKSPHYENKVVPLYLAGDKKTIRVLMMLIRDKQTTYEEIPNAATLRHEIWQYTWRYGAWQKEKRTKVMDRVILNRDELRQWTWLWDPKLGGIKVGSKSVDLQYELPKSGEESKLKGLYPY